MTAGSHRRASFAIALLTSLNLLNYLDRLVLAAVLEPLSKELRLSSFLAGAQTTIFLVGYFLTSPLFGRLGDRRPRVPLVVVGALLWCAATVATGFAIGAKSLALARAGVGIGEASFATLAPTIIDDLVAPTKRGRSLAIFYAAVPIGSACGYLIGGAVLASHGWRAAFFVAGAPGLLLALAAMFLAEPPRGDGVARARETIAELFTKLGPFRTYWRTVVGYAAYTFAMGGLAVWAPSFVERRYGMAEAAVPFGAVTVVAGLVGTALGGFLADRALAGKADDATVIASSLRVSAISTGLAMPLVFAALVMPGPKGFFALTFLAETALFVSSSPINVVLLRSVPESRRASAMALAIFFIHLFGDLWSPPLIGGVSDAIVRLKVPLGDVPSSHAAFVEARGPAMMGALLVVPFAFGVASYFWATKPAANPREGELSDASA